MERAELEITAPISRDELLPLLDAMAPEQRPSTPDEAALARARRKAAKRAARKAAKKAARRAPQLFSPVELDSALDEIMAAIVTPLPKPTPPAPTEPPRENARGPRKLPPFSHLAALLPPTQPVRFPRATRPPMMRAKTPTGALSVEDKAAQTVAELRTRLDTVDETPAQHADSYERVSFPSLSPGGAARGSSDELALVPTEMRLALPEVSTWRPPARIEMTPVPGEAIDIHSARCAELGHMIHVSAPPRNLATIALSFTLTLGAIVTALYFLV